MPKESTVRIWGYIFKKIESDARREFLLSCAGIQREKLTTMEGLAQ
jgi:hypothetical protein